MNDAQLKEAAFLLGELNLIQLYTLVVALIDVGSSDPIHILKVAIAKLKELNKSSGTSGTETPTGDL